MRLPNADLFQTLPIVLIGEIAITSTLSIALAAFNAASVGDNSVSFVIGVIIWTLGEYLCHRFVLHYLAPLRHRVHHTFPSKAPDEFVWQIWICFGMLFWIIGGTVLAGVLGAYAYYLLIHHCAHQRPDLLPKTLLRHHNSHHKFAKTNYGVTTTVWDHCFGTIRRCDDP
ncbi:MAG: sterol desaturase family protein [Proteobacteria bacterium]|nr:sterol desaturase family protein [Pseudomonadota bacterium]